MPLPILGLAATAAALVALLLIYALTTFAKGIAGLIPSDVPVLSTLHKLILVIADVGAAAIQWIMCDVVRPIINIVTGPVVGMIRFLAGVEHFAQSMAGSWVWLLHTGIPRVITLLEGFTVRLVNAARTYAVTLVHALAAAVTHDLALVRAYSVTLVHALASAVTHDLALVRAYAVTLVHALAADVVKDVAAAEAAAIGWARAGDQALGRAINGVAGTVAGLEATSVKLIDAGVARAITVAEGYAAAQAANAIHVVDVEAAGALAAVADGLIIDVGKLADVIGTDLPDIGAAVRAIPRAVPTDLAGTLGMVGALSVPMIRFMEQCGIPNCRNLSQVGRELRDLLGALEDGTLIAFLAMLCTDPQGAASVVTNDLAPIIDGAVGAARDLMGVA